ncbi:MAG: hypothetical protein C0404_06300 [Verrucomicrobia bacterium]|nr:hypothetical protein [Verrucomicrobiota bacterium]
MRKIFIALAAVALACSSCQTVPPGGGAKQCQKQTGACCPREGGTAKTVSSDLETRLTEMEKRLDYLTSELALQRGDLDRVREKVGTSGEEGKK